MTLTDVGRTMPYPHGAVEQALKALELAYSYLREKPLIEVEIRDAMRRLERFRELAQAAKNDGEDAR